MEIVIKKVGSKGSVFQLHSGEIKVSEKDGLYFFQGSDSIARELVVRHGFKYARGVDRDWAEKALKPPKKRTPAKKAPAKKAPAKKATSKK